MIKKNSLIWFVTLAKKSFLDPKFLLWLIKFKQRNLMGIYLPLIINSFCVALVLYKIFTLQVIESHEYFNVVFQSIAICIIIMSARLCYDYERKDTIDMLGR